MRKDPRQFPAGTALQEEQRQRGRGELHHCHCHLGTMAGERGWERGEGRGEE